MEKNLEQKWMAYSQGTLYDSYRYFGAHPREFHGKKGTLFAVWAPHARNVSLVGSFNDWDSDANPLIKHDLSGVWWVFVKKAIHKEWYKYLITASDGSLHYKADPFAFSSELRPETASVVTSLAYDWKDQQWWNHRQQIDLYQSPMNIYEVHAGSWRQKEDGRFLSYRELADKLVPYMINMHYNYLELMPVMEHPYDGSWGYQTTGYYAVTKRHGEPQDLMYLVDLCHQNGIGVILDWVPGHFCRDAHGLLNFDGEELYGGIDHPNWGTKKFDFGKGAVKSFLISNALFYFEKFHIDGLRVDGVTSILQLNFGMEQIGYHNHLGGMEDLNGIQFIKDLNETVFEKHPKAIMAAEESTDWPLVTSPVDSGGLGFNFKWNMGWMNDTLRYLSHPMEERKFHHDQLTFSLYYAFSENFILPFSHDEVVHGKKSLVDKGAGDYEEKFKTLKLIATYQMTHPGKKLNFMGNELAPFLEWRYDEALEWFLLKYPKHDDHQRYIRDLNLIYSNEEALWLKDNSWEGFQWIDANNRFQSVFSYVRWGNDALVLTVLNFKSSAYEQYRIGVPLPGEYQIILNSDWHMYGNDTPNKQLKISAKKGKMHGMDHFIELTLPGLTGMIIKRKGSGKKGEGNV